jgi:hypothetical protein
MQRTGQNITTTSKRMNSLCPGSNRGPYPHGFPFIILLERASCEGYVITTTPQRLIAMEGATVSKNIMLNKKSKTTGTDGSKDQAVTTSELAQSCSSTSDNFHPTLENYNTNAAWTPHSVTEPPETYPDTGYIPKEYKNDRDYRQNGHLQPTKDQPSMPCSVDG